MIIGLGSDLCNIERIRNSLDRFGDRVPPRLVELLDELEERLRARA